MLEKFLDSVANDVNEVATPVHAAKAEVQTLIFDAQQASLLHKFSEEIAVLGGPQSSAAKMKAAFAASELKVSLSSEQHEMIQAFSNGLMAMIIFEGMLKLADTPVPEQLPSLAELENNQHILLLASRNQILLKLVDYRSFAYDMDNDGKLVRLVANFKGGGAEKIAAEPSKIELSSHSGLPLGPHTEAPYWCSVKSSAGRSPAPSALILTAMWNPRNEPTTVIPMAPVLDKIGITNTLALTSRHFNFTRSDSFVSGKGEDGKGVSIVDFDEKCGFAIRFNSYRFSVDDSAADFVKNAYQKLCQEIDRASMYKYALSQESAIIINNCRALHCRDIVEDNRRLLVRLFGSSKYAEPVVLSDNPLLVHGE